jgi:uncharacterized protein
MAMRRLQVWLAALAALALSLPAEADPSKLALRLNTDVPAVKTGAPAMWRIADGDSRVYLFGTFHLLPKDVKWTTPAYKTAMADAEVTVIEVDTMSSYAKSVTSSLVFERGVNASFESLSGILGKDRYAKLQKLADRYHISEKSLQRMRPWLAMVNVSAAALNAAGFDRGMGVERIVMADAADEDDRVAFLESIEDQIKTLASLEGPEMLANMDLTIEQLNALDAEMGPMLAAWLKGDVVALDRYCSDDMRRRAPGVYKTILVDRNRNWIAPIERWLGKKDDYFVAVGAAHLVGRDSVIAMLEKKGYKVERIQ